MLENTHIAIVEIGGSHDECILTQLHAAKNAGLSISLIITQKCNERNTSFSNYCEELIVLPDNLSKRQLLKALTKNYKTLKKKGLTKLILNTAQGWVVKRLCMSALFDKVEFIGIFHDALKYKTSFGQKLIRLKVRKRIFLSDFMLQRSEENRKEAMFFYPIHFDGILTPKTHSDINIAIIGGVESIKKDIHGFLELAESTKSLPVNYYFLGKSDDKWPEVLWFKNEIVNRGFENRIIVYDHFVSNHDMNEALAQMNAILPLTHPNTQSGEIYFKTKISGSMNVALGYKIPLLLHESLASILELKNAALYYNFENFNDVVQNGTAFEGKRAEMKQEIRFTEDFQESKFIDFILRSENERK